MTNAQACSEWEPFILRNAYYFQVADNQNSFGGRTARQLVLVPNGASEPQSEGSRATTGKTSVMVSEGLP